MVGVGEEGVFRADAFAFVAEVEFAVVVAEGAGFESGGEGADNGFEVKIGILEVGDGVEVVGFECGGGDGADAVDVADGLRAEEGDFVFVADEGEAVGFLVIAAEFGEEFVGSDADAGGEVALVEDAVFDLVGELVGLVEGVDFWVTGLQIGFVH